VFFLPDQHYAPLGDGEGGVDRKAESCALQAIQHVKPDAFVNLGDVGEWSSVSPWRYKKIKRPPLAYVCADLKKDIEAVNAGLDKHDKVLDEVGCKERHLIEGNHEIWVDNFCVEYPDMPQFQIETALRLNERGYQYHPYGEYVPFGNLWAYHGGHWSTKYHSARHIQELGASVIYGHYHDQQTSKAPTLGGYHGAWSIGCICEKDKMFNRGRPVRWSHNFAVVHLEKDGTFHVDVVEIYDGVCYVWGKRIRG